MSESPFTPKISRDSVEPRETVMQPKDDHMGSFLLRIAQYVAITLFGLTPIFFTPGLLASLGFDKVLLSFVLIAVITVTCSMLVLRRTHMRTVVPAALGFYWLMVIVALASGLLSGDTQDALRGSAFETQTVGFLALLGLVMVAPFVFQEAKIMSLKAIVFFCLTGAVLLFYGVLRIVLGAGVLDFGSFGSVTATPLGGFNDLAIFAGLMIIVSLVTLLQLPLRTGLQFAIAGVVALSLMTLSVVNFFNVWIVVGFFGLLVFLYLISRDTLFRSNDTQTEVAVSPVAISVTLLVCAVSALFIIAGDFAGSRISEWTGVNYVEVRPSGEATISIAGDVYRENVLLGIGPNRFADAWRLHKDRSINETIFWDTDFVAGSGFVPTLFVNLGVLGGGLFMLFHGWLLYLGYRMLLRSGKVDPLWYYIGTIAFSGTVFLWGMSYLYVPGAAILLLAAFFSGLSFVAAGSLLPTQVRTIPLAANRQRGFVLMAVVIVLIVGSVATLFSVGKQYVAQASFTEAQLTAESIPAFEQSAANSFSLYPDDRFLTARAQIQLANLSTLLSLPEPTQEQQQRFLNAAEQGLVFAEQAVAEDPTNPDNRAILAGVYSNLAVAGIEGAQDRADVALAEAQRLDPLNPGYRLLAAQMAVRTGSVEQAREEIAAALELKRNYTAALYLSAQLDISQGNVEAAINTTRAIITLEPNNPTRYFQLGFLLSANEQSAEAISAYQAAVALDPQYANARYLLALEFLNEEQVEAALEQLRIVAETNQENQELLTLIEQLESGEVVTAPDLGLETPVADSEPGSGFEDTVITDADVDTDLVSPVNTVPEEGDESLPVETEPFTDPATNGTSTAPTEPETETTPAE